MNQQTPKHARLNLTESGISLREASIVQLSAEAVAQHLHDTGVSPGPVLLLNVCDALLTAARRRGGLQVKPGRASRGDSTLLSLLMRSGRHVAMCLADLGDPTVQAYAMNCVANGRLLLILRSPSNALVSTSELSDEARSTLRSAYACRAASPEQFTSAANSHLRLISDDGFLREHGIDVRRVRSRTMLLHAPASESVGLESAGAETMSIAPTLH